MLGKTAATGNRWHWKIYPEARSTGKQATAIHSSQKCGETCDIQNPSILTLLLHPLICTICLSAANALMCKSGGSSRGMQNFGLHCFLPTIFIPIPSQLCHPLSRNLDDVWLGLMQSALPITDTSTSDCCRDPQ